MLASAAPPQFCSAPVDSHEPCVANRGAQEHTTGQQRSLQRKHLNRKQGHPNPDYPPAMGMQDKGVLEGGWVLAEPESETQVTSSHVWAQIRGAKLTGT